ncbi:hypothetical protein [Candidatus Uabimicrobium sp. HlEnr_7]|uniref:hypothetical protein n=1 Tax=Candidatus Uabimicrobium helgolandensis TaxID=3095367 RepID=UPI003558F55F
MYKCFLFLFFFICSSLTASELSKKSYKWEDTLEKFIEITNTFLSDNRKVTSAYARLLVEIKDFNDTLDEGENLSNRDIDEIENIEDISDLKDFLKMKKNMSSYLKEIKIAKKKLQKKMSSYLKEIKIAKKPDKDTKEKYQEIEKLAKIFSTLENSIQKIHSKNLKLLIKTLKISKKQIKAKQKFEEAQKKESDIYDSFVKLRLIKFKKNLSKFDRMLEAIDSVLKKLDNMESDEEKVDYFTKEMSSIKIGEHILSTLEYFMNTYQNIKLSKDKKKYMQLVKKIRKHHFDLLSIYESTNRGWWYSFGSKSEEEQKMKQIQSLIIILSRLNKWLKKAQKTKWRK